MKDFVLFGIGWATRSIFVVLSAYVMVLFLPRASAATKNLLWRCALGTTILVPFGMALTAQLGINLPTKAVVETAFPAPLKVRYVPVVHSTPMAGGPVSQHPLMPPGMPPQESDGLIPFDIWTRIGILYVLGFSLILGRWIFSLVMIRRLKDAGRQMHSRPTVWVINDPSLRIPATYGWRKPVILLPIEVTKRPGEKLEAIILHETSHIKRFDWAWQCLATFVAACQWFNPVIWLLSSCLKATAEESADDLVLNEGVAPSVYATELMSFASATEVWNSAVTFTHKNRIRARLDYILDPQRNRGLVSFRVGLVSIACCAVIGGALASLGPSQLVRVIKNSSDPNPMPAAASDVEEFAKGAKPAILYVGPGESSSLPTWNLQGLPTEPGIPAKHGMGYGSGPGVRPSLGPAPVADGDRHLVAVAFSIPQFQSVDILEESLNFKVQAKLGGIAESQHSGGFEPDLKSYQFKPEMPVQVPSASASGNYVGEASFTVPKSWKSADLELGMGAGPFRKVGEWIDGKGDFDVKLEAKVGKSITGEGNKTVTTDYPVTFLHLSIPKLIEDRSWRLTAYDSREKAIHLTVFPAQPDLKRPGISVVIGSAEVAPSLIHRLVINAREYTWAKVTQIPLYPKTK